MSIRTFLRPGMKSPTADTTGHLIKGNQGLCKGEQPMRTKDALKIAVIALAGVAVLGQTGASAAETTEFYGTGFRNPSNMITEQDVLSDCGDTDKNTNVVLNTLMGTVAYTGIIQGNG